jgi:GH15 family glucan-1,4-alpha-glucosidase
VVYLIDQYYRASHDAKTVKKIYQQFVVPDANFMCRFIDPQTKLPHASYDLWEEKFLTSTYTVATVIAGLTAAASLAEDFGQPGDRQRWSETAQQIRDNLDQLYHPDGYFRKGFLLQPDGSLAYDDTVDISSLFGVFRYAGLNSDDQRLASTANKVESTIVNTSPSQGVLRYTGDNYFRSKPQYQGNPWIVSTLWLAQYYQAVGRHQQARELLEWAYLRQLPSGALSEQFDPETAAPLGVTPLVWSQTELINTILDVG